ncbi:MAG: MBL fold metallo-hydrolase [Chloroflexota bacterium]
MIFRQILHPRTGCASYVFGCLSKSTLAVVDPHVDHVADYLGIAEATGAKIDYVIETHVQADHLSAARELADRTGASIVMHLSAPLTFPFRGVKDDECLQLGNTCIRVLHTPGHAPEHISLLVGDRTRSGEPWFVCTGDTLFVGDVARPDLGGADSAQELAGQLYDSLFHKLLNLPDTVEVYPSHFAGSACGRAMSAKPSSTIGFERHWNMALKVRPREEFIASVTANLPAEPDDLARIRRINLGTAERSSSAAA